MKTLYAKHALLPAGWAENVRIELDGDSLAGVEQGHAAPAGEAAVDVALPGVANLHSHAFQRALAGRAESGGDDFWSWRRLLYRATDLLEPPLLEAIAAELYMDMLAAGYTAVAEFHYVHHRADGLPYEAPLAMSEALMRAAAATGIRMTLLPVFYERAGFETEAFAPEQRRFVTADVEYAELVRELSSAAPAGVTVGIAFHSLRAVSPESLLSALALLEDLDVPRHIHAAEQPREVEECREALGRGPVAWLAQEAGLDERWCIVHATHANEAELATVARTGAVIGLCPTTEANLGDGLFSLPAFVAAGGRFGIGSDSHVSVDPWEELRWLEYGQRLAGGRRLVVTDGEGRCAPALLQAAVAGGAQALGGRSRGRSGSSLDDGAHDSPGNGMRDDRSGSRHGEDGGRATRRKRNADSGEGPVGGLRKGAPAELLAFDLPDGISPRRLLDELVFVPGRHRPEKVMAGGRWRIEAGRHADEAALRAAGAEARAEIAAGLTDVPDAVLAALLR